MSARQSVITGGPYTKALKRLERDINASRDENLSDDEIRQILIAKAKELEE